MRGNLERIRKADCGDNGNNKAMGWRIAFGDFLAGIGGKEREVEVIITEDSVADNVRYMGVGAR